MRKILALTLLFSVLITASLFAMTKPQFVKELPYNVGLVNSLDNWQDLPVASTAAVLNSVSIATATLVAASTTYYLADGDYTDIVFPRNITADCYFSTGESTTTVTGNLVVVGLNQFGVSTTETIAISTNAATGVVCWSTITSLTYDSVVITDASTSINLSVGTGTKIALSNNIESTDDIIKVIEAGATSTTYTANATYDSIIFASAPDDSKDFYCYYESRTNKTRYNY